MELLFITLLTFNFIKFIYYLKMSFNCSKLNKYEQSQSFCFNLRTDVIKLTEVLQERFGLISVRSVPDQDFSGSETVGVTS